MSGGLVERVRETSRRALASGALESIKTERLLIADPNWPFQVRILTSLAKKHGVSTRLARAQTQVHNPFLNPEPALLVCEMGSRYRCVLNKFNVVEDHLLLVTRQFEPQQAPLEEADFDVLLKAIEQMPGLGFFNGGPGAGASQPHRHLQLVPEHSLGPLPVDKWLARGRPLPFTHRYLSFDGVPGAAPLKAFYDQALIDLGLAPNARGLLGPYNLLVTRQWAILVPRRQERYRGLSVNALGFAGALLLANREPLQWLKREGIAPLLRTLS
ncbi:DUF4922 domain-containing protein [Motiliproteus sp. SC1-56]|uniref:DUF4922 domain-containing protein n=1 Tax=Motiliproteus sp. SC1-56 TaxID=2799565 RepID=UPI001A90AAD7|nr:DUF4922 domain-containing protein [Motiliproteus sp. SC1-56]